MGRLVTGVPGRGVLDGVGLERETGASRVWVAAMMVALAEKEGGNGRTLFCKLSI